MVDGCTLSNSLLVGVHNISKERLVMELANRGIPLPQRVSVEEPGFGGIPTLGVAAVGTHVLKYFPVRGTGNQIFRGSVHAFTHNRYGGKYTILYDDGSREGMDTSEYTKCYQLQKDDELRETAYVVGLREVLVKRLKEEEEYERLTMYSRDDRFARDVNRPKWEAHRIVICMLHCLMRMHEKVLFLLYFAAMKSSEDDLDERLKILDRMTAKTITIGNLSKNWSHTLDKDKQGNDKLLKFKMNYDVSKKLFNYNALGGLYELIDLAELSAADNLNWRAFIVSYVNCMELLTLSRDYEPFEIDELDTRCKKMYHLLITSIGGLEACTNYFHLIGSGHVLWMVRRYGNLWRYRNEGVEAFNQIVSLRHNKHNKKGGYKKTRLGAAKRKCEEFWSLGQWLARWSMWHLGYADAMNLNSDDQWTNMCEDCVISSDYESDASFDPHDCSDSEMGTTSDNMSEDNDEDRWNGVWYASSQDYDSDGDDTDSISESVDDHENSTDMDYARAEGLENLFPHSSPSRMSQHESRTHRLYDRACTAISRRCTTV